jgi:hypothetical protein
MGIDVIIQAKFDTFKGNTIVYQTPSHMNLSGVEYLSIPAGKSILPLFSLPSLASPLSGLAPL